MTHTPTPYRVTGSEVNTSMWIVDAKNRRICTIKTCDHDNDNAAFIVRCCNSHDQLVKTLQFVLDDLNTDLDSITRAVVQDVLAAAKGGA